MGLSLRQNKDLVWLLLRDMTGVQGEQPRSLEICGQTSWTASAEYEKYQENRERLQSQNELEDFNVILAHV